MSRAFRENQVDQIAKVIRENSKPEEHHLSAPLAHRIYNAGGRMVPLWVMVIWATLYEWWLWQLIFIALFIYFLVFVREEVSSTLAVIAVPIILITGLIMPYFVTRKELKEQGWYK